MIEFLNKIIDYLPQLSVYIILIIIIAFICIKGTKFYIETKKCNSELPEIKKTLTEIHAAVITLNTVLLEKNIISQSCYSSNNSPRAINQVGRQLLNESGAALLFNNTKQQLVEELHVRDFNSELELERASLNLLLEKMNNVEFISIQNFVFEHPAFNGNPLTYTDILFLLALELRDEYKRIHSDRTLA